MNSRKYGFNFSKIQRILSRASIKKNILKNKLKICLGKKAKSRKFLSEMKMMLENFETKN